MAPFLTFSVGLILFQVFIFNSYKDQNNAFFLSILVTSHSFCYVMFFMTFFSICNLRLYFLFDLKIVYIKPGYFVFTFASVRYTCLALAIYRLRMMFFNCQLLQMKQSANALCFPDVWHSYGFFVVRALSACSGLRHPNPHSILVLVLQFGVLSTQHWPCLSSD